MLFAQLTDFTVLMKGVVDFGDDGIKILNPERFKELVDELVFSAVFNPNEDVQKAARWLIWEAAAEFGAVSASINDLYMARGKDAYADVCVPAVNIRGLTYESARAMFRAIHKLKAGPFIFEIAKSEIGYTFQRPEEYVSVLLGAAIKEGYSGPVCIQGDHFQVNLKKYQEDAAKEVEGVRDIIKEAVAAGFYNIDIDTSTLVDLDKPTVMQQQKLNYDIAADLTALIREIEPDGVTVSVGGEIGEVGGKNSTVEELEAFIDGYIEALKAKAPNAVGISKISVQTGTSHGGVPLADGSVAEVALDFSVLEELGGRSREKYGIGGVVQHGASTLPDEAFHRFKETQTTEVHLATGFQNLVFDHEQFPYDLRERVYQWLAVNCAKDRKEGMTDEQFVYKTRKKGFGPYKWEMWTLAEGQMNAVMQSLEEKFLFLFDQLGLRDTRQLALDYIKSVKVKKPMPEALGQLLKDPKSFGMMHGAEEDAPGAD